MSVRYNSQKTAAKADGELKAQLDEVDKAIADARRAGNAGADLTYIEVVGGSHTDMVVPSLPLAFEFMSRQKKGAAAPTSTQ